MAWVGPGGGGVGGGGLGSKRWGGEERRGGRGGLSLFSRAVFTNPFRGRPPPAREHPLTLTLSFTSKGESDKCGPWDDKQLSLDSLARAGSAGSRLHIPCRAAQFAWRNACTRTRGNAAGFDAELGQVPEQVTAPCARFRNAIDRAKIQNGLQPFTLDFLKRTPCF